MQLPVLRYDGPTHLVKTEGDLQRALQDIRHERIVGFDTEARPTFRKGQSHAPSLVQIATNKAAHLFQLAQLDCSHALAGVFGNAQLIKAGVALSRDLSELQKLFSFEPANIVDLGDIAKRRGLQQTGLRNLSGIFLGGRITKGSQTSNWAQQVLTPTQLRYAATDAWASRELYLRFESLGLLLPPLPPQSAVKPAKD